METPVHSHYVLDRELDNLENVVTPKGLEGGYWAIRKAIEAIERNKNYKSTVLCEPQMGKRDLYSTISTRSSKLLPYGDKKVNLMTNFISFCDGKISLLEIADKLNIPIWDLYDLIDKLHSHDLIHSDE